MRETWLAIIPATIPTLAVSVGILLNQNGISRLGTRITALEGRVNALSKQLHDDIVMLVGQDTDKAGRLARLEERWKS
jgi:hypothetical protein